MPDRPRTPTELETLHGVRDALRYLLIEVEGIGPGAAAESIKRAIAEVEAEIRRRLS